MLSRKQERERDRDKSERGSERGSERTSTSFQPAPASGNGGSTGSLALPPVDGLAGATTSPSSAAAADGNASGSRKPMPVRFRAALRNTVYEVMKDRGWKEVENEDWELFWADVHWVHETFDHVYLAENQRINHFRNHYELTRKDLLVKNVKRMIRYMEKEYGRVEAAKFEFICPSYVLPQDYALFQEEFKRQASGSIWIMKPVGRAQGKGIFLVNRISQISQWKKDRAAKEREYAKRRANNHADDDNDVPEGKPENYIVQKYIENPYLIGGKKFDIRIYVLVTSYTPLIVYVHRNGFCRFSNSQFSLASKDISNLYIHATNVAIQKTSPHYRQDVGCKWLLRNLRMYLTSRHGRERTDALFTEMEALIVRSLMCVQRVMIQDKHCFELYGYDVLIDDNLRPWLIEVNASPSLTAETQWDYDLKHNMLNDVFDVVDQERRFPSKERRQRVGGFDLVYNDGPVKHERSTTYMSYLGCYHPIPRAPRVKKSSSTAPSPMPQQSSRREIKITTSTTTTPRQSTLVSMSSSNSSGLLSASSGSGGFSFTGSSSLSSLKASSLGSLQSG